MRLIPILGALAAAALLHAQTPDTPPSLIYRSEPEYSTEATRARVQATVTLSVTVGEDGKAHDIHIRQGAGFGLDEKAVEAMQKWRFNPGTHNGQPAGVPANIEMNFSILARNDKIDHSGQRARLNFTLPPNATRPELIIGQLPGNPAATGDQLLRFHIQVDAKGTPQDVTPIDATDLLWEKQALLVVKTWRFEPAQLDGKPIPVEGVFELAHSGDVAPPMLEEPPAEATEEAPDPPASPAAAPMPLHPPPLQISGLSPRAHQTATLLANGTVLLAGGVDNSQPLAAAQIYDWATHAIVNTASMHDARQNHVAALLRDGTVLIAGGSGGSSKQSGPLTSGEIFDPSTGTFSPTGSLHEAREFAAAAALPDGRILICGGLGSGRKFLASTEIYTPRTKTFTPGPDMTAPRSSFSAIRLKDGRIFLLGGPGAAASTTEIYDPASNTFHATAKMTSPRYFFSTALLASGKVLIAGGTSDFRGGPAISTTELYDPAADRFEPGAPLTIARMYSEATVLPDGKVLLTGGVPGIPGRPLLPSDLYDPATGTFTAGPTLRGLHLGHTATVLQDGSVLIAGSSGNADAADAELIPAH
ncbi:MAG TPA: TonB family protein [Bryobacteraceae bacterium]|nr:TonB family protein [Bryobacteraceae bacterium]